MHTDIPLFAKPGYTADDTISSAVQRAETAVRQLNRAWGETMDGGGKTNRLESARNSLLEALFAVDIALYKAVKEE